jgi:hypothetical protein
MDELVRNGHAKPTDFQEILGSLGTQSGLNVPMQVHNKYLQCGDSYHAFLATTRFTQKSIKPGKGFFDGVFRGLTEWCVTSLIVEVDPKHTELQVAKHKRSFALSRELNRIDKGKVPTARDRQEIENTLKEFDDIDMVEGGYAWYSLALMVSADSPEELEDLVQQLIQTSGQFHLKLRRITGASLMKDSLYTMVGLK